MRAKLGWLWVMSATCAAGVAAAQSAWQEAPPEVLSLRQVIERAVTLSPPQLLAAQGVKLAEGETELARAPLRPQVSAEASQVRRTSNPVTFGFNFPGMPSLIGPYNVFDARLKLSQRLLDLGAQGQLQAAKVGVQVAQAQASMSREQSAAAAAAAYIAVLGGQQALSAAQADLGLAEELLTLAKDQRGAGISSGIEVARAETAVAQDRYAVSAAETSLAQARLQLQRIAVLPMGAPLKLDGELNDAGDVTASADAALTAARKGRPELAVLDATLAQARASLEATRKSRLPTVSVFGDYGMSANTPTKNEKDTYTYGAMIEVPIFAGGSVAAQSEIARIRSEQTRIQLEDLYTQVEQEVRLAVSTAVNTGEQVKAAGAARDLAQRELELARDRFANGVANNVDVVSAQTSLARARAQYVEALAAFQRSRLNLAAAQGQAQDFHF